MGINLELKKGSNKEKSSVVYIPGGKGEGAPTDITIALHWHQTPVHPSCCSEKVINGHWTATDRNIHTKGHKKLQSLYNCALKDLQRCLK
jgi:hypothetical protein